MRKTTLIRQHCSLFWRYYAAVGITLLILACGLALKFQEEKHFTAISTWPEARARIRSAEVFENRETISADLDLTFQAGKRTITTRFTGTFTRYQADHELSTLREGREIPIRYNPANPAEVSLYPRLY